MREQFSFTTRAVLLAAAAGLAVLGVQHRVTAQRSDNGQQWDPSRAAVSRCEQALEDRMARESGGRYPDAGVNARTATTSRAENGETSVRGTGRYRRDQNDSGRAYSFTCTYDSRRGQVTSAEYRWTGAGFRNEDTSPGYRQPITEATPNGRVWYSGVITSQNSGRVLDVSNSSTADTANVQQWDYNGGPNQVWDIIDLGRGEYSIVSQGSNKVLDVANGSKNDGGNVQQYRWNGGDNQKWRLERAGNGAYQIVNVGSEKCLDVDKLKKDNGVNVQQWTCNGGPNQQWKLGR